MSSYVIQVSETYNEPLHPGYICIPIIEFYKQIKCGNDMLDRFITIKRKPTLDEERPRLEEPAINEKVTKDQKRDTVEYGIKRKPSK